MATETKGVQYNKKDLSEWLHLKFRLPRRETAAIVDYLFDKIKEETIKGNEVRVKGFGKFYKQVRKEKECVSPYSGERIKVGERAVPRFVASNVYRTDMRDKFD